MEINKLQHKVKEQIRELQSSLNGTTLTAGLQKFENGDCCILSQSPANYVFEINDENVSLEITTDEDYDVNKDKYIEIIRSITPISNEWESNSYACLLQMQQLLKDDKNCYLDHKKYSHQGMITRVMDERRQKANNADYRIKWGNNIYGDHILTNERGVKYKIFLRDFENETGYSNSQDSGINKLGTTKHIMFAFNQIKNNANLYKRLRKRCPFVEIYCDPLNGYSVRYFLTHEPTQDVRALLNKYFNSEGFVEETDLPLLTNFFNEAQFYDDIVIRPEVKEKVNNYFENKALNAIQQKYTPDFKAINATLYDYQKEGVEFVTCKKHAIIADEMGLGKTIQAIGTAMQKKELFGFSRTMVVCPASLKAQWKSEIEKFTCEKAEIIQGTPKERATQYQKCTAYFLIVNYETVLRDQLAINKAKIDFLILDEAQKVKNYATKSASAIKNIGRKHVLIITGTPIENKLIDLFSLMTILDPQLLGPLWEFSYKHCLFDNNKPNKINAYYNLSSLKEELKSVLLRREKRKVIKQLPNVQQQDIPVKMTPLQADFHASYASGIGQ